MARKKGIEIEIRLKDYMSKAINASEKTLVQYRKELKNVGVALKALQGAHQKDTDALQVSRKQIKQAISSLVQEEKATRASSEALKERRRALELAHKAARAVPGGQIGNRIAEAEKRAERAIRARKNAQDLAIATAKREKTTFDRVIKSKAVLSAKEKELARTAMIKLNYDQRKAASMAAIKDMTDRLAASTNKFTSAEKKAILAAAGLTAKLQQETQALGEFGAATKSTTEETKKSGSQFVKWGLAIAGAALVLKGLKMFMGFLVNQIKKLVSFVKDGIKVFGDFQYAMAEVWTLTSEGVKGMDDLSESVRSFAVDYAVPAKDAARALYMTISAGFGQKEAAEGFFVMGESLKFAKATMTSAGQAVDIVTTVLNAYSLEAEKATYVTDILFKTIKLGKTTGPELALSFGRVASMAAAAQVPLEDMAAATVALTRAGLKTDEAMTALRQVLNKVVNPTEGATKAVKALGLELFSEATLRQRGGLVSILEEISAVSQYTSKDLQMLSELIPNIRAVTGLAAMSRQLKDLPLFLQEFAEAEGAAQEATTKMMTTLRFHLEQVGIAWENLKISIGEFVAGNAGLLLVFEAIVERLKNLATSLHEIATSEFFQRQKFEAIREVALKVVGVFELMVSAVAVLIDTVAKLFQYLDYLPGLDIKIPFNLDAADALKEIRKVEGEIDALESKGGIGKPIAGQMLVLQLALSQAKDEFKRLNTESASFGEGLEKIVSGGVLADLRADIEGLVFKPFGDIEKEEKAFDELAAALDLMPMKYRAGAEAINEMSVANKEFGRQQLALEEIIERFPHLAGLANAQMAKDAQDHADHIKRIQTKLFFWWKENIGNAGEEFQKNWGIQSMALQAVRDFAAETTKILATQSNSARQVAIEQAELEVKGVRAALKQLAEDRQSDWQIVVAARTIQGIVEKLFLKRMLAIHKKHDLDLIDSARDRITAIEELTRTAEAKNVPASRARGFAIVAAEAENRRILAQADFDAAEDKVEAANVFSDELVAINKLLRFDLFNVNLEWDNKDLARERQKFNAVANMAKQFASMKRGLQNAERQELAAQTTYEQGLVTLKIAAGHKALAAFKGNYEARGAFLKKVTEEEVRLIVEKYSNMEDARQRHNATIIQSITDMLEQSKELEESMKGKAGLSDADKARFEEERRLLDERIKAKRKFVRDYVDLTGAMWNEINAIERAAREKQILLTGTAMEGAELALVHLYENAKSYAQIAYDFVKGLFTGLTQELESYLSSTLIGQVVRDPDTGKITIEHKAFSLKELGVRMAVMFQEQLLAALMQAVLSAIITSVLETMAAGFIMDSAATAQALAAKTMASAGLMMMAAASVMAGLKFVPGLAKGGVIQGTMLGMESYASGGIANSPQLAVFGEGGGAEAFVPLPDGRSIPVSLEGGVGSGPAVGNVIVEIVANDTKGFDRLLAERQDLLVGLITEAVDNSLAVRRRFQN